MKVATPSIRGRPPRETAARLPAMPLAAAAAMVPVETPAPAETSGAHQALLVPARLARPARHQAQPAPNQVFNKLTK